jgi:hypothetical protein
VSPKTRVQTNGAERVRQNRVVLAVVATVKPFEDVREPNRVDGIIQFARRRRPEGTRLPGERGISRPTIAQGRPCVRLHLYAAVRFFLRVHFAQRTAGARSAPGLPCALCLKRGREMQQGSGEISREDADVCLRLRRNLENAVLASYSVIASAAKQSRIYPRRDTGWLRRKSSSQ